MFRMLRNFCIISKTKGIRSQKPYRKSFFLIFFLKKLLKYFFFPFLSLKSVNFFSYSIFNGNPEMPCINIFFLNVIFDNREEC